MTAMTAESVQRHLDPPSISQRKALPTVEQLQAKVERARRRVVLLTDQHERLTRRAASIRLKLDHAEFKLARAEKALRRRLAITQVSS